MTDVIGHEGDSLLATSRGGVVSARGTGDGVVLRLDGRIDQESLRSALGEFMEPRKTFLGGHEVSIEWVGTRPGTTTIKDVTAFLSEDYGVTVRATQVKSTGLAHIGPVAGDDDDDDHESDEDGQGILSLFDGMDDIDDLPDDIEKVVTTESAALTDPSLWDDPDARIIYSTLRSGQKIESEHSLIIVGDINPGAEVVAGGDVIVLGTLRGIAHAGAYDETGGGRSIFALSLQPTQLRIGTTITRGCADGGKVPEIAKVEGNIIVVEPFMKRESGRLSRR
ncbi:MAG: septum site-determining protein MinC [Deltaproteobacteria bacterium]|nr:septum site-determining protein MinC [Deltaproteobacteria bacterium]